jgi:hypothetical protein
MATVRAGHAILISARRIQGHLLQQLRKEKNQDF